MIVTKDIELHADNEHASKVIKGVKLSHKKYYMIQGNGRVYVNKILTDEIVMVLLGWLKHDDSFVVKEVKLVDYKENEIERAEAVN